MARNTKAKGKIVRRLQVNVFGNVKYDKLLKKKPHGPGVEKGKRVRKNVSDFGKQLLEKQKIRFAYGISEKQFRNVFYKAKTLKGITGTNMLILLERRLDNIVFRLGMGMSRSQARQFVSHGHVYVNGRRVNIPSYLVRPGDEISLKPESKVAKVVRENIAKSQNQSGSWMSLAADDLKGKIERLPEREEIPTVGNEQLVVEYYAK